MKKRLLTLICYLFATGYLLSQVPQAINYQAIARDKTGNIIADKEINLRISLIQGSKDGQIVYSESHLVQTNRLGLINLSIGKGQVIRGEFSQLKWEQFRYFIKVEMDIEGLKDYRVIGTSELLSVPYAFYAEQAGNIVGLKGESSQAYTGKLKKSSNVLSGLSGTPNSKFPADGHSFLNVNTGNVGIGTTNPSQKLEVNGNITANYIYGNGSGLTNIPGDNLGNHSATQNIRLNNHWLSGDGGNEGIYVNNSGNIGMGYNNPNRRLYVSQYYAGLSYPLKIENKYTVIGTSAVGILFSAGGDGINERGKGALVYECKDIWNKGSFHFLQHTGDNYDNPTTSNAVMTIKNDGNVGIGTSYPQYELQINSELVVGSSTKGILLRNTGTLVDLESLGRTLAVNYSGPNNTVFNVISGRVGIGSHTPSNMLDVKGAGTNTGGGVSAPEVVGRFRNTISGKHTAISIDASSGQDPILYFSENGSGRWDIRNDADDDNLEIRYQIGGANQAAMRIYKSGSKYKMTIYGDIYPSSGGNYYCGGPSNYWFEVYSDYFVNVSDKKNIVNKNRIGYGLKEVMKLNPISYLQINEQHKNLRLGFIAEEVSEYIPEATLKPQSSDGNWGMKYNELIPVLVKAFQEQQEIIEDQQQQINELRTMVEELMGRLDGLNPGKITGN